MSDLPKSVRIMEVGPRDGLQIEKVIVPTKDKAELVERIVEAGVKAIEVGSFVNPKAVPQMADSGEVYRLLRERDAVEYHGLWLNAKGLERALENGRVHVTGKLMIAASDAFLKRNTNKSIAETLASFPLWIAQYRTAGIEADDLHIGAAFGCNFQGEVPVASVVDLIARSEEVIQREGCGLRGVSLADTMGWGTPLRTQQLIGAIRERWPHIAIKLHLHDTRGTAMASAAVALSMGIREFDASIGGLGGCPFAGNKGAAGNVCSEDLVFMCEEMGIETGIDLNLLIAAARRAQDLVGHELPGKLMKSGGLRQYRGH
jgi:hydroxymethylglutaryl-CoA lyase